MVDDDPEVHAVTRLALGKLRFAERPLRLLGAFTAAEAEGILRATPDVAIALLDVVMETDDAGLRLVRTIREELGNRAVRLILRTGQPGQAPEASVILAYDINDYRAKTELTTQKLFTTVIAALRAYADIVALEAHRRGLHRIVESTGRLFAQRTIPDFARAALAEIATVLDAPPNGILCGRCEEGADIRVLAGSGPFAGPEGRTLAEAARDPAVAQAVARAFAERCGEDGTHAMALHLRAPEGPELVAWHASERALGPLDHGLARVFASKIAIGFSNVRLYERLSEVNGTLEARVANRTRDLEAANAKLERLARLDVLTEIWNRRHFLEMAEAELVRARRHGRHLSVFLLDLDHFKRVNDTHGHAAGDETLREVVRRAQAALRASDMIARFGGEEFVVLLPETALEGAAAVAERVRAAIAARPIALAGRAFAVSASIGVAQCRDDEASVERTLVRADEALYRAKTSGRDRVCRAADA